MAAFFTTNFNPHTSFLVNSFFGLLVALAAHQISDDIDKESDREVESTGFINELVQNGKEIY